MENNYLAHYGIKGMHWGVRRFQNPDGTRTAAGREREREMYGKGNGSGGRFESVKKARQNLKNIKSEENKLYKEWISRARKKDLTEEEGDAYDRKTDKYAEKRKKAKEKLRQEYKNTLREINKEATAKYKEIMAEVKKADNKAKKVYTEVKKVDDKAKKVYKDARKMEKGYAADITHPISAAVRAGVRDAKIIKKGIKEATSEKAKQARQEYVDSLREIIRDRSKRK